VKDLLYLGVGIALFLAGAWFVRSRSSAETTNTNWQGYGGETKS
jgi:hypothetical protein